MRVIVTRVAPQAAQWVKLLSDKFDAVAMPLIVVSAAADGAAIQAAGQRWGEYCAAMFVSSHAVNYFFQQNKNIAPLYKGYRASTTRVWATGPGTRLALLANGMPEALIDSPLVAAGQFDSEALWQVVHSQACPGQRVLIVRGDTLNGNAMTPGKAVACGAGVGRDWLAQQLQQAQVKVDFLVGYQRAAPLWSEQQKVLARAAAVDGSLWLFSSVEALAHLQALLPGQDWSAARAVATHSRIGQAVRELGFGTVALARPTLADIVASIESLA